MLPKFGPHVGQSGPPSGRDQPGFGRHCPEFGPCTLADSNWSTPTQARSNPPPWPEPTHAKHMLVEGGPTATPPDLWQMPTTGFDQTCGRFDGVWSAFLQPTQARSNRPSFGRTQAESNRHHPEIGRMRFDSEPKLARARPSLARVRPSLGGDVVRHTSACRNGAMVSQTSSIDPSARLRGREWRSRVPLNRVDLECIPHNLVPHEDLPWCEA